VLTRDLTGFQAARPHSVSRHLALFGFRARNRLTRLVAQDELPLMTGLARNGGAHLLVDAVMLARNFAGGLDDDH
jgi:hypothetical protein